MKLPSDRCRLTSEAAVAARNARHAVRERGIALVITLVMLSITLVMVLSFIAITERERSAVNTGAATTTARNAADSALAAAQSQILANIFSSTNAAAYDFRLLVSTNYINLFGFVPGVANPTNVNFDYDSGGNPLTAANFQQNIANLYFQPRVPVYVTTNTVTGARDFRFYYDLNRNHWFEDSGLVTNIDNFGIVLTNNATSTSLIDEIGDPQWIGVLERPDLPHGPENYFIARYCFLAQPIGNSLDVNGVHNEVFNLPLNFRDGFLRNQNIGGWEVNLAAFFADLNTNIWGQFVGSGVSAPSGADNFYHYQQPNNYNVGVAFDDARAVLAYRYNFSGNNQKPAGSNFFYLGNYPDNVDLYSDGALQTTINTNLAFGNPLFPPDNFRYPWAGSDNTNRFYSLPTDFYDTAKLGANFVGRFAGAATNISTYDRYTYYRLLDQLGTDAATDDSRMNLNYDNVTQVNGTAAATNLLNWSPINFFTTAADRLLKYHTAQWRSENYFYYTNTFGASTTSPFGVANIPVYVNGRFVYTPAVNRLLQLAANLYDATTNDVFPSVFRPIFSRVGSDVYITGYTNVDSVTGSADVRFSAPFDITEFAQVGGVNVAVNISGVPWILGAKKYLPNFNRFYSLNEVAVTRKLQVTRPNTLTDPVATNSMYVMGITNRLGWSFWNSYNTNYPYGQLEVVVSDNVSMLLSNSLPGPVTWFKSTNFVANFTVNPWPGSAWTQDSSDWPGKEPQSSSFVSGTWDFDFLPESIYRFQAKTFESTVNNPDPAFEVLSPVPAIFPPFVLWTTNHFQAAIIDTDSHRIVDYVQFDGPSSQRDIYSELARTNTPLGILWDTNMPANSSGSTPNWGMLNQINASLFGPGQLQIPTAYWKAPANIPADLKSAVPAGEIAWFLSFYTRSAAVLNNVPYGTNLNLVNQVPLTPSRVMSEYTMWQVNDPLVHYLTADLSDAFNTNRFEISDDPVNNPLPNPATVLNALANSESKIESRYQPWGRAKGAPSAYFDDNPYNVAYRDPLKWSSDFWNFPTNKLPSAGWIGRVHRGTPWQTVFLKSTNILAATVPFGNEVVNNGTNSWQLWTGADLNRYDATHSAPIEDRLLFDLFKAAPNNNALRGALPVNQPHLAAWSALFGGMVALSNITYSVINDFPSALTAPVLTNVFIDPAGVDGGSGFAPTNSPIRRIQSSIFATRADTNLFPQGVFTHVGDILRVPAISDQSPFIDFGDAYGLGPEKFLKYDIGDELYEWLPQQMMGLVRLGSPRYVVYCYGQALAPAKDGKVLSGTFSQLVTNYQVTAESAARVVLRVDNASGTNVAPRVIIESYTPLDPQ